MGQDRSSYRAVDSLRLVFRMETIDHYCRKHVRSPSMLELRQYKACITELERRRQATVLPYYYQQYELYLREKRFERM